MTDLGVRLPLRVRRLNGECIAVEDATGARLACMYMDTDETRRRSRQSLAPAQAEAIAKVIARSLTAHIEGGIVPDAGADTDPG